MKKVIENPACLACLLLLGVAAVAAAADRTWKGGVSSDWTIPDGGTVLVLR